jgi:hypothetical protein
MPVSIEQIAASRYSRMAQREVYRLAEATSSNMTGVYRFIAQKIVEALVASPIWQAIVEFYDPENPPIYDSAITAALRQIPVNQGELASLVQNQLFELMVNSYELGAKAQNLLFGGDGFFSLRDENILESLRQRARDMSWQGISSLIRGTAFDLLRQKGLRAPDRLAEALNQVAAGNGNNLGRFDSALYSHYSDIRKIWRHERVDKERRPEHARMDNVKLDLMGLYPVGSGALYPQDWDRTPDPGQWINCHCFTEYTAAKLARGVTKPWDGRRVV